MYLVTQPNHRPFLTIFFDPETHWQEGMIVYHFYYAKKNGLNLTANYTTDGYTWQPIEFDSL